MFLRYSTGTSKKDFFVSTAEKKSLLPSPPYKYLHTLFKARSAFSKQLCLSSSVHVSSVCHTFLYGKSLPLFLSDIFSQIFSKCRIFPDIVSGRDIFIFSYLCFWATYFHKWSMIFNDQWYSMIIQCYCIGIITNHGL